MNMVKIILDVDKEAPLDGRNPGNTIQTQEEITFTRIPFGMESGRSAVGITAKLPDGRYVFIEMTMSNFEGVAAAFRGAEERARDLAGLQ